MDSVLDRISGWALRNVSKTNTSILKDIRSGLMRSKARVLPIFMAFSWMLLRYLYISTLNFTTPLKFAHAWFPASPLGIMGFIGTVTEFLCGLWKIKNSVLPARSLGFEILFRFFMVMAPVTIYFFRVLFEQVEQNYKKNLLRIFSIF
jgi:hypothetical protein